jgi:dihydrofolate synthase/folylpolyglutamate synthase
VSRNPLVVLDGAHNPDGARSLTATLAESFAPAGRLLLVVGMLGGRDVDEMLAALDVESAALLIACTPPSARGVPAADVAARAHERGVATEIVPEVAAAVSRALGEAEEGDVVVITGSLYVVGAARAVLPGVS